MRRLILAVGVLAVWATQAPAHGLLIPEDKSLPPLAMLNHQVKIQVTDQVAVTRVEQTFRNHTARALEATYLFPVPKGASVNRFTMWVDGKEVKGELLDAAKAREIYTSIVRRTQDPGLLEYIGNDVFRMRVFPVPANGDQKVALSYTSVANRETGLVEYVYPLKTDGKATATLEDFSISASIKSQHGVQNVYSPTHAITLKREGDNAVEVTFNKKQGLLDKDFQLFYQLGDKDVGLTALTHRPVAAEDGYSLMLITPRVEIKKEYQVPRDMVLVLDTSGSMRGPKMDQARKAVKFCLDNLAEKDRFAVINFSTTVNKYRDSLSSAAKDQVADAKKWVDDLDATGGTAINDAMMQALEMRDAKDDGRTFTVIFFTDGQPTIGETNIDAIVKNTLEKNSASTRIFTFGVGDDVNASLLDQVAEKTRALPTYVRPQEDIEAKVSGLYSKISHPVLANLKVETTGEVRLNDVYPPQLPDLFHGQQLTVCARYKGKGPSAIKLTGTVGKEKKEFVYEITFPDRTPADKDFVEQLWAHRKVGYMLDQIRANGEKKELVQEVVALAKRYGITTPYTSWLIVPEGAVNVVIDPKERPAPLPPGAPVPTAAPPLLRGSGGGQTRAPATVEETLKRFGDKPGDLAAKRDEQAEKELKGAVPGGVGGPFGGADTVKSLDDARGKKESFDRTRELLLRKDKDGVQAGKLGVDLAVQMSNLRNQTQLDRSALRNVQNRNLLEIGGVWIDEGYTAKTPTLVVKAQSNAYFRMLEKRPEMKDVFRNGNHLVWITPSGTALIIDANSGKDELKDDEIEKLFVVVEKKK